MGGFYSDVNCVKYLGAYIRGDLYTGGVLTEKRKIHVIRINTFTNALMFILHELKDIPSGE